MTHPVPAGHQRLPGFDAPGTRPKIPSATVGIDTANERHFIADTLDSLVHKIQRVALFSGDIEKNFKEILDHTKAANAVAQEEARRATTSKPGEGDKAKKPKHTSTEDVRSTLRQADVSFGRAPARTHDTAPWQHGHPVPVSTTNRAGKSVFDAWHPGQDRPLIAGLPGDVDWEGREHGLNHMDFHGAQEVTSNWSVLRQHAAQRLNQKLSERTPDAPYHVDGNGRLRYARGHPDAGKFVRSADLPGAKEEMAGYAKGLNRMANIQGAINNVGRGEGLSGALGAVGTKLGWVGAAYGAVKLVGGQISSQREKNAYYQSIYGGSNTGAFAHRMDEEGFARFKMFGTMGGDQARELFRGVSQIGLQGDGRQSGLDFAVRNYRRTGLDTKTSVEILRAAVENGVTEFSELGTQLDLVAKAAKQAGINVGEAQKQFAETYRLVSTSIVAGSGTAAVAGGLQAAQSALGQGPMSRLNLSQLAADPTSQRLQATALHMSPISYANQIAAGGPGAQSLEARGMSAQLTQAANMALSPKARARMMEIIGDGPPPQNQADFQAIASQLQQEGLLNTLQAQQVLSGITRQNIDPAAAGTIAVSAALGAYQKDIHNTLGVTTGAITNRSGKANTKDIVKDAMAKGDFHWNLNKPGWHIGRDDAADARHAYAAREAKTGVSDSFANRLVHEKNANKFKVRVVGKDGQYHEVSVAEAMKNDDYYKQVISGKVQIKKDSKSEAISLADMLQGEDTAKARSKATGKTSGKLEIYATPELRRLLGFNYYGGDQAGAARAEGVPAPASGTPTTATAP